MLLDPVSLAVGQSLLPSALTDTPREVQALAAFLLTVLFGGVAVYRYGGRIDDAVEASMSRPVAAVGYGLIAYGLVAFVVVYAFTQMAAIGVEAAVVGVLGAATLLLFLVSLGGLGFVVVGTWLSRAVGARDPWIGLVGVGLVGAIAWLLLPFVFGLAVWLAMAAVGIGGPARKWIHADAVAMEDL
jgi:hypothetical protein